MKTKYLETKIERLAKQVKKLSEVRLLLGVSILTMWLLPVFKKEWTALLYPSSIMVIVIFALVVYQQLRRKDFLNYLTQRQRLEKPSRAEKIAPQDLSINTANPLWEDLDIFHRQGLFSQLNFTPNKMAAQKIIDLMGLENVTAKEIQENQTKVKFLVHYQGLRKILLTLFSTIEDRLSNENLKILLKQKLILNSRWLMLIYGYYLLLWLIYAAYLFFATKPYYILGWIGLLIIFPVVGMQVKVLESYPWVNSFDSHLVRFKKTFVYIKRLARFSAQENISLLVHFKGGHGPSQFEQTIKELSLISSALGIRQNFIIYGIVHAICPWDFYWTSRLEKVKQNLAQNFSQWLEEYGDIECYSQIAEFSTNLSGGIWPQVLTENLRFNAIEVIHPLMSLEKAVANSLELVTGEKQLLIITGSNMAGKSTFLRALAMNQLLAQMGAKVRAREFTTAGFKILTSLKRIDSLEDSFSTFYSEVKNLKWIMDQCMKQPCLFFIDEIFRGTNNKERLIGAQKYITQMVKTQSIGMITSHDLELSQMAKSNPTIFNEHFADRVENGRMLFDYLKKPGPCPSTNALKVMEMEGLFTFAPEVSM